MKRIVCLTLLICLVNAPTQLQAGKRLSNKLKSTRVGRAFGKLAQTERFSRILDKRLRTSFETARELQKQHPQHIDFLGEPIRRVRRAKDMPTHRVYADKPFLTTRRQTANYMAAKSNRAYLKESKHVLEWIKQLKNHLPQMQKAARQTADLQAENFIPWLTEQIPARTTTLFVGEMHGFKEIHQSVEMLLISLHEQNPNREIILFTEFLPKDFQWSEDVRPYSLALPDYAPIWQQAARKGIPVIGLEEEVSFYDFCDVEGIDPQGNVKVISQWAHLEGMRIRNESWTDTLTAYRKKYPHALFVVYTGAAHSSYYFPYSLSTALHNERPFVLTLYPDKYFKLNGRGLIGQMVAATHEEPLEALTKHIMFKQAVLQFKDPELSRLAGFDVRLKIPINLEQHAEEKGF